MSRLETPAFPGLGDRRGWLTVHTLSEFVFCPRAGAISHFTQQMDEVDSPPPRFNLDYLPEYSVALIEEALNHQLNSLRQITLRVLAAIVGGGLLFWWGYWLLLFPIAAFLLHAAPTLSQRLSDVLLLISRRRAAQTAQAREPVQGTDQMQRVNWWELLRAGFESEVHEFVLEDESLQLAGRPWRVLSRGSLRIPVVKALTPEGDRSPLPKPQQAARIAAYCRLLASSVGGESPFGIVIFGGTYEGWAVPNTAKLQEELEVIVARAKQQFAALSPEDDPGRPESTSICTGCPHGLPVPLDRKSRLTSDAPRHGVTGRDGKLYHSPCGERYGWSPPHYRARQLGLSK